MMHAVYAEFLNSAQDVLMLAHRGASATEAVEGGQTIGKIRIDVR